MKKPPPPLADADAPVSPTAHVHRFDYDGIPEGYYQTVAESGHPVRRAWQLQKFARVLDCLPTRPGQALLDIGCFAGTFLSMLPQERFSRQVGVDILQKQIDYARRRFETPFRTFIHLDSLLDLRGLSPGFDCITLIEVIEHLTPAEIRTLLERSIPLLNVGGKLVLSTPNYASTWPVLEKVVNALSDISYEEQHLTRFTYFNLEHKMRDIYRPMAQQLQLDFKTTTHFLAPFLGVAGVDFANTVSSMVPHVRWRFPFGNLILASFTRTA